MSQSNPLLDINTSFADYLVERTRSYQEHVVGGTLDYAFDADFAIRQKIGGFAGWSRLHKAIVTNDIPNRFKKIFQSSDAAGSMQYSKAYEAAKKCSERLQIGLPVIFVRKTGEVPEIMSLDGEGIERCIVMTGDIAEGFTSDELCYVIGCECGRLQNRHAAFNYAFTYPGISRGETGDSSDKGTGMRELSYSLNKWLIAGDITADRAGIICLDDPTAFPEVFASVRRMGLPDSYGDPNPYIDIVEILTRYETLHVTPVRELKLGNTTPDARRVIAGMEFINCEILYLWRPDIPRPSTHISNKQSLEIRCDIIADADSGYSI